METPGFLGDPMYAYEARTRRLYIVYTSGPDLYRYKAVPSEEVARMEAAESLGNYVATHIKPNYDGEIRQADGSLLRVPRIGRARPSSDHRRRGAPTHPNL
jgi:hypothetical protein